MRPTLEHLIIRPVLVLLWHQLDDVMDMVGQHSITTNVDGKE
jgi:hypothetical protein